MMAQLSDEKARALQEAIGYSFRGLQWLEQALTTRSYRNEHPTVQGDNQPLATLGDAVIRLLVINHLFKDGVRMKGDLTTMSEAFVKGSALTTMGIRL